MLRKTLVFVMFLAGCAGTPKIVVEKQELPPVPTLVTKTPPKSTGYFTNLLLERLPKEKRHEKTP